MPDHNDVAEKLDLITAISEDWLETVAALGGASKEMHVRAALGTVVWSTFLTFPESRELLIQDLENMASKMREETGTVPT